MKINGRKRKIFVLALALIMVMSMASTVFAEATNPTISFTSSSVIYNKEAKLLRFNLVWSDPQGDAIDVMYSLDDSKAKVLGTYDNQDDQIIAHIYLEEDEVNTSVLKIYAVDTDGNTSEPITSEFQLASSSGITISDGEVPLSVSEGTWSLVNLFLAALSVAMVAVSLMLFIENKSIESFRDGGKVKSVIVAVLTIIFSAGNIAILLTTQDLKHQVVMIDNMTVAMLIITVLSIVSTMILAARAFGAQSEKELMQDNI